MREDLLGGGGGGSSERELCEEYRLLQAGRQGKGARTIRDAKRKKGVASMGGMGGCKI